MLEGYSTVNKGKPQSDPTQPTDASVPGPKPISDTELQAWKDEEFRLANQRRSWGRSPTEFYGDIRRAQSAQGDAAAAAGAARSGFYESTSGTAGAREQSEAGRNYQMGQLGRLSDRAAGYGPSVTDMQMRAAMDQGNRAAQSMAAGARGGNMLMAQRAAAQQQAFGAQQVAQASGIARLQEQMANEQALAQAAAGMRGQDQGDVQTWLGQRQQDLGRMGLEYGRDEAAWQREMDIKRAQLQGDMHQYGADRGYQQQMAAIEANKKGVWDYAMPVVGAGLGAAAMYYGAKSDERVKTSVMPGQSDAEALMDSLSAKSFRYRDPGPGEQGQRLGIMAQDLEKTDAGRSLVSKDAAGVRRVDVPGAAMASLAAVADVHERLRRLEEAQAPDKGRATRGHR